MDWIIECIKEWMDEQTRQTDRWMNRLWLDNWNEWMVGRSIIRCVDECTTK